MAKVRRETYSCTGRGFSMVDADGYMARLLSFMVRPNVHGSTQAITSSTFATSYFNLVGHGYVSGQSVALTLTGDGALPTGGEFTASTSLAYPFSRLNITEYFVIKISNDIFQLASSHYNAMAGTPITFADDISGTSVNVTALGGGAEWYLHDDYSRVAAQNFATTDVDTSAETITLPADAFSHCHKVTFSTTGAVPGGLTAGTSYWLIRVSSAVYKVASSEANAYAGTAINLTSQGTGTHTCTAAEHFVILTDTSGPVVNDYNTSPAGCAPKFVKIGYVNSESGYVRMQAILWWDNATHSPWGLWSGLPMATYDSAVFAYQFIAGDEFMFQAAILGATWDYMLIDTFTGITNKLEAITKVGIVQSGLTAGSSVVVQLDTGEASNFTVGKFYYLYDFDGHAWMDYCEVTARDTVADTITLDTVSRNYPAGAVITPYAHRYYTYSARTSSSISYAVNMNRFGNCVIPYQSGSTASRVLQDYGVMFQGNALFAQETLISDSYLATGIPDDEGYYDCMRHVVGDYYCPNNTTRYTGSGSADSANRLYSKSNNVLKTYRSTMGQMVNTRTLNGIDYLMFTASAAYCDMITYSESAS